MAVLVQLYDKGARLRAEKVTIVSQLQLLTQAHWHCTIQNGLSVAYSLDTTISYNSI